MSLVSVFEQKELLDQLAKEVYKKAQYFFLHFKSCITLLLEEEVHVRTGKKQIGFTV